jgi:CTP synthase (UTP-ammonia lyase)
MRLAALGDRDPTYLTHREIDVTLTLMPDDIDCAWIATDSAPARDLGEVDGVWLLPGTPYRDDEAAYRAIRYCIETRTPFLGTCGGFQYACVELAKTMAEVSGAAHAESEPDGAELVIEQLACSLYGERRTVVPVKGTRLAASCGSEPFEGYHYCGYGLADQFARRLSGAGVVLSATADDAGVEAIELPDHPFFVATAFQPQVGASRSRRVHPLIEALLSAVRTRARIPQA